MHTTEATGTNYRSRLPLIAPTKESESLRAVTSDSEPTRQKKDRYSRRQDLYWPKKKKTSNIARLPVCQLLRRWNWRRQRRCHGRVHRCSAGRQKVEAAWPCSRGGGLGRRGVAVRPLANWRGRILLCCCFILPCRGLPGAACLAPAVRGCRSLWCSVVCGSGAGWSSRRRSRGRGGSGR